MQEKDSRAGRKFPDGIIQKKKRKREEDDPLLASFFLVQLVGSGRVDR